jgi:hypothetical protein
MERPVDMLSDTQRKCFVDLTGLGIGDLLLKRQVYHHHGFCLESTLLFVASYVLLVFTLVTSLTRAWT